MRNLIVRSVRRTLWLASRDERGAVGVIVALLIGAVLLGMAALAVDVGQIYQNRAELQNGADAGALAVAQSCAQGSCNGGLASNFAVANASKLTGGNAAVDLVCGSAAGLAACPASTGAITDCPPAPPGSFVDVHTSTELANNSTLLPPVFSGVLGFSGAHVKACAQALWGAPSTLTTIALTISACEWDTATKNGTLFAPAPPYPPDPAASYDQAITLHSGVTSGTCQANPADSDAPGAFGWTQNTSGTCSVIINNNQYQTSTGSASGPYCSAALQTAWANHTVVYVPVYSSVSLQGSLTYYTLKGFAAFVVTGYRVPGGSEPDWLNPGLLCGPPNVCVDGVFTQALCTTSCQDTGGKDLGLAAVRLSG